MSTEAFLIAGDRIVYIANPCGAGLQYRAHTQVLPPEALVPVQHHDSAETVIVIKQGTLEVMSGGASGYVSAGNFVRIPPKVAFAYRNAGDGPARLLMRTSPVSKPREALRIIMRIAAA